MGNTRQRTTYGCGHKLTVSHRKTKNGPTKTTYKISPAKPRKPRKAR